MKTLAIGDVVTSDHPALAGVSGVVVGFGWQREDDVWVLFEPYRPTDQCPFHPSQLRKIGKRCNAEGLTWGAWLRWLYRWGLDGNGRFLSSAKVA